MNHHSFLSFVSRSHEEEVTKDGRCIEWEVIMNNSFTVPVPVFVFVFVFVHQLLPCSIVAPNSHDTLDCSLFTITFPLQEMLIFTFFVM